MHISSNEVPIQNQLTMGGVTHKSIYMFKSFNFINDRRHPLLRVSGIPRWNFKNRNQVLKFGPSSGPHWDRVHSEYPIPK